MPRIVDLEAFSRKVDAESGKATRGGFPPRVVRRVYVSI